MFRIRRGKDFKVIWSFFDCDGKPYLLEREFLTMYAVNSFCTFEVTDFTVDGNTVIWLFRGKDQKNLGDYTLELVKNNGEEGMIPIETVDAFTLVQYTRDEARCDCGNVKVEDVTINSSLDIDTIASLSIDTALSTTSNNAIANFVVTRELNKKQDTITDLATIRSGAAKGATAVQNVISSNTNYAAVSREGFEWIIAPKTKKISEAGDPVDHLSGIADAYDVKQELAKKVDKVSGKQLSTEDFTTALKQKLQSLNNYDDSALSSAISSLQNQINTLVSGNASSAIDTFNEIIAFLNGVKDTQDLAGIIASIEQQIASVNNSMSAELAKKPNKTELATINGQSLTNGGNIVIEGKNYDAELALRNVGAVDVEGDPEAPDAPSGGAYDDTEIREQLTQLSAEVSKVNEKITNLPQGASMSAITYADLVALRDNGKLVAGSFYRITDYITTTAQENTQSAGHPFDVIVLALSENTLAEEAYAIQSARDTDGYFANSNLSAWKIWYELGNDSTRFAWADEMNGKGVIYRMIDEWNNDLPYDFKNILFTRYELNAPDQYVAEGDNDKWIELLAQNVRAMFEEGVPSFIWSGIELGDKYWEDDWGVLFSTPTTGRKDCYTFSDMEGADGKDTTSDASLSNTTHDNKMETFFDGECYRLPNNILFGNSCNSNSFGNYCSSNSFGNDCNYNSFGNSCNYNSFGNSCSYNSFGNSCNSNSFGNYCNSNSFGNDCSSNSFGNDCYSNSFGNGCNYNSFGNDCNSNSFGNYCYYNSFGNSCSSNSFGNDCNSNSFGNYCNSNSFSNSCNYNSFGNDCYSNSFGNDCYSNSFVDDGEGDGKMPAHHVEFCILEDGVHGMVCYIEERAKDYSFLRYMHICRGVSEDEIYPNYDVEYETCYARKSDGTIRKFVLADLKAS